MLFTSPGFLPPIVLVSNYISENRTVFWHLSKQRGKRRRLLIEILLSKPISAGTGSLQCVTPIVWAGRVPGARNTLPMVTAQFNHIAKVRFMWELKFWSRWSPGKFNGAILKCFAFEEHPKVLVALVSPAAFPSPLPGLASFWLWTQSLQKFTHIH